MIVLRHFIKDASFLENFGHLSIGIIFMRPNSKRNSFLFIYDKLKLILNIILKSNNYQKRIFQLLPTLSWCKTFVMSCMPKTLQIVTKLFSRTTISESKII